MMRYLGLVNRSYEEMEPIGLKFDGKGCYTKASNTTTAQRTLQRFADDNIGPGLDVCVIPLTTGTIKEDKNKLYEVSLSS